MKVGIFFSGSSLCSASGRCMSLLLLVPTTQSAANHVMHLVPDPHIHESWAHAMRCHGRGSWS